VLTLHGGALPAFARRWAGRTRRLLGSAAAVTAPSSYLVESLRPYRSDLRLIPNGLDIPSYPFRLRAAPRPKLMWLRAFHRIYDPVMAVRTLDALALPEAALCMIGPDKGDGSLQETRAAVERLNLGARVEFAGAAPKSQIGGRLHPGDIFLNTSTVDNTPVSVLEAMACGACVVSTRVGGIPYLVADGEDGLLVEPGNAEAMAAAVRRILNDGALAASLSANARRKAERCDWSRVVPQWNALLYSVAGAR
jgi:glycosyltransferase involved in cell wall biosynthesis